MGEVSFICSKYRELAEENDNHPTIFASKLEDKNWVIFDEDEVVSFITEFEHGVIHSIDGNIPLTSENMGILRLEGGKIKIRASVRSSIKQEEADRVNYLNALAKIHGFSIEILCQI